MVQALGHRASGPGDNPGYWAGPSRPSDPVDSAQYPWLSPGRDARCPGGSGGRAVGGITIKYLPPMKYFSIIKYLCVLRYQILAHYQIHYHYQILVHYQIDALLFVGMFHYQILVCVA